MSPKWSGTNPLPSSFWITTFPPFFRLPAYLGTWIRNGIQEVFQKRYRDGKFSLLLLGISLPIQIVAWGWLAYQYFWTGEVTFTIPTNGPLQKYTGWLFFSPALVFFWPFALWYFPYLSGGGKLGMTLFSLAIYRMTVWCTQILYKWYAWQEQLHQLQTQAANQLGYINNTITDWYGLIYIKFKETAPIYQHNAEYLIQQQLDRFQAGSWSDFAQKHGQLAANHFQEKLEEMKEFTIQLLQNRPPEDLDPAPEISWVLEKKIQAELPASSILPEKSTPWWQTTFQKIQEIDWSDPQVKTVGWAVGGLIVLGLTYWGVHSLIGYFFGSDKRMENLAGIVTNHEQDMTEIMAYLQQANDSQKQEVLALLQGLQDNHQLSQQTADNLLTLQHQWWQPDVQKLIDRSTDLLQLVNGIDPESFHLLNSTVNELKNTVEKILLLQEEEKTVLSQVTNHFYQLCNRLNIQIASELRPRR